MSKFLLPERVIPFIVSLAFFMEAVDSTVINTAIPAISRSLHVDPVDLKVALISYLLSLAIFIPISGWLADKYGDKRVLIAALSLFTLSSLWCGFAQNLSSLVVARFIQGFGGALTLPVGRLIIIRTFGQKNLFIMMNRVVIVGSLGMMLGPAIGGFITHYFSWHWIFWVNIPVGLLAILLASYSLQKPSPQKPAPLDKVGFVLFGGALATFTSGLSALSQTSVNFSVAISIILVSALLFILYTLHSRHVPHPIIKRSLFKLRTFQVSVTGNLISRLGFAGVPFVIPLFLQIVLGYSPEWSGLMLSPMAIGIIISKPITLPLLNSFGYKKLLIVNTGLTGVAVWLLMFINVHTSPYTIAFLMFVYGFIVTIEYSLLNSLIFADVSENDLSATSSITSTIQQLSQSFGVAVSAIFIRSYSSLYSEQAEITITTIHLTLFSIGLLTILSATIFLKLKKGDGHQMIR